jgi:RNA polymerase sigma factor (sigma-70 family)
MENDAELLTRYAKDGAEDAFAEVARRHIDAVYSTALRRVGGDTHIAEDVAQEVFVALARQAAQLADHPALLGWLYTTARNIAVSVVRRERRRKTHELEAQNMQEALTKGRPEPDWNAVSPLLENSLDELTEPDRSALLLRFFGRHTFAQIGSMLQLTEDAARKRVDRALDRLHERLARKGVASSGAALAVALANHAVAAAPTGLAASIAGAAVAAPPTALAVGASALGIMQSTHLIVGVGLVMIAALGTAFYESTASRTADSALTAERLAMEGLLARQRDAEARAQSGEREAADLARQLAAARARASAVTSAASLSSTAKSAASESSATAMTAAGNAFLVRHPEVKRALIDWRRAEVNLKYAALFKSLALSPERLEELKTLLVNYGDQYTGPFGPNGAFVDLRAGDIPRDEVTGRLRAFLGNDGYRAFQEFQQTVEPRRIATKLATALALSDAPLTADQANQFVRLIAGNRASGLEFDWNATATGAQGILSPAQFAAFQRVQTQTRAEYATIYAAEASSHVSAPNPGH